MSSKAVLFASLGLFLCAKAVGAADYLTDAQMDRVTAGQVLGLDCSICTLSSSNSMSTNGVTTMTNSSSSGGTSSGGGTGGSGGSGSSGGGGGTSGSGLISTSVQVPASVIAILTAAATIH